MNELTDAPRQRTRPRRVRRTSKIPREFAPLINAHAVGAQQRIELWCYALLLLMLEEEQVRVVKTYQIKSRTWLTLETRSGEEFDLVKPELSESVERQLLEGVSEIIERRIADGRAGIENTS